MSKDLCKSVAWIRLKSVQKTSRNI